MSEPSKEIVRTAPSPAPNNTSLSSPIPAAPIRRVPPTLDPLPASAPRVKIAPVLPGRVEATSGDSASGQPGLRKETARLAILPTPPIARSPALNSTQTTPLPVHPEMASGSIPRSFSWVVFGLAALIFLIQILNYVVS